MDTPKGPLVSPARAAEYLGCSRPHLYRLLGTGAFSAVKMGSKTLVAIADLDRYIAALPAATIRPPHRRKAA